MNNKIVGAILLAAAGIIAALGAVCMQIAANTITVSFYVSHGDQGTFDNISKMVPSCWWPFVVAVILALFGLAFLFSRGKSE